MGAGSSSPRPSDPEDKTFYAERETPVTVCTGLDSLH
jgi:hypothetical protein